tara:strand:+ start:774 stop:971 length:198 start_codon:yes stop_codon:yes gene_type:complete
MNLSNPMESEPQNDIGEPGQSEQGGCEQSKDDGSQKPIKIPSLLDSLSDPENLKGKRIRIIKDED